MPAAAPSGPPTGSPVGMPSGTPPRIVPSEAEAPVPAAPCVAGIAPPRGRVVPAEIPAAVRRAAPCSEHRGYVFGLDPDLVAGNDDIVESRIVRRGIGERTAVAEVVVTRRHPVGRRLESPQTARIGTLVRIGQNIVVRVRTRLVVITVLRSQSLRFGDLRLPLGAARLGLGLAGFGSGLLLAGDGRFIVQSVQIVVGIPRRRIVARRTAGQSCGQDKGSN